MGGLFGLIFGVMDVEALMAGLLGCFVALERKTWSVSGSGSECVSVGGIILWYTILYYIILYYTILYYTILYYMLL